MTLNVLAARRRKRAGLRYSSAGEVKTRRAVVVTIQYGLLIALGLASFFLIFLMLSMSLRNGVHIYVNFWNFWPWPPYWDNYQEALLELMPAMGRTMFVCVMTVGLTLIISLPAGYAFARIKFPGGDITYFVILAVMVIPGIILLAPHYVQANQLHLVGSLWSVIVFPVAGGIPWAVFLLATFFKSQPQALFDSARIDGATELQALIRIAIPLAIPIIITIAMLRFMDSYGDFIWPTLMLSTNNETLMMAIQHYNPPILGMEGQSRKDLGLQTAGYAFATVPQFILFALGMKYFIKGVTSGAIKL